MAANLSYIGQKQATIFSPNGNVIINMVYSGEGQSGRLSMGTTTYQNDQTGIGTTTDTVASKTTAYTNTPDGDLISQRIPSGATGCPTGGPAVCTFYYLYDGLGSVVAVADSSGNIKNSYQYDPFGNATATETVPNIYRFTGAVWDSQTGLYKMGERFYDPTIGCFTQADPSSGQGYSYTDGNPVNFVDPSGLKKTHKPKGKGHGHKHGHAHKPGTGIPNCDVRTLLCQTELQTYFREHPAGPMTGPGPPPMTFILYYSDTHDNLQNFPTNPCRIAGVTVAYVTLGGSISLPLLLSEGAAEVGGYLFGVGTSSAGAGIVVACK